MRHLSHFCVFVLGSDINFLWCLARKMLNLIGSIWGLARPAGQAPNRGGENAAPPLHLTSFNVESAPLAPLVYLGFGPTVC